MRFKLGVVGVVWLVSRCAPVGASTFLSVTDTFETGEVEVVTRYEDGYRRWNTSYFDTTGTNTSNANHYRYWASGSLSIGGALTSTLRINVRLPYLVSETQETTSHTASGLVSYRWQFEGAQDISVSATKLLINAASRWAVRGRVWFPTGDTAPSFARVTDGFGNEWSPLKIGGAGTGRTDARIGVHWSRDHGYWVPHGSISYLHRGDKINLGTASKYADTLEFSLGGLFGKENNWGVDVDLKGGRDTASVSGLTANSAEWFLSSSVDLYLGLVSKTYLVLGAEWGRRYDKYSTIQQLSGHDTRIYDSIFFRSMHMTLNQRF